MGLLPCRSFQEQQHTFLLKTITHGDIQFVSWMKYCKAIIMDYPSGNPAHAKVYVLVAHHFLQDK